MNISIFIVRNLIVISTLLFSSILPTSAQVFPPLLNDISDPADIFFPLEPTPLILEVETVTGKGSCKIVNNVENYTGCTLADVNADTNNRDAFKPEIKAHIVMGSSFPDDGKVSNATLRQRGGSARFAEQKSYRIKLDSKDELWRGERKLQLNKHPWNLSRVANKLSFDLMQDIHHLPSLRTDFINVFIDNVDYGLFTHVENVGKEYLTRRGFHKDSPVYKADHFDFFMTDAYLLNDTGKPIDKQWFNSKLKIKRGKNHKKVLEMITAVNNASNNFSTDVMAKYFNKNNYLSWMSVNFLFGNIDAVGIDADNFYLLNPKGKDTFYFLPWDYDEAWDESNNSKPSRAWSGVSAYWSSLLHQRYLKQPDAVAELNEAVLHIKNTYLTPQKVAAMLDAYKPITLPLISAAPDFQNLPYPGNNSAMEEYTANYNNMYTAIERNYQIFKDSIHYPMGFWIRKAELANSKLSLKWTPSYDLQGDSITYDVQISTSLDFASPTVIASGLTATEYEYNWNLPSNPFYYVRVLARDSANPQAHWQVAFNEYISHEREYHGIMPLQDTVEPAPIVPPTCEMGASPQTIQLGESTAIWWDVLNASTASINHGVDNVTPLAGDNTFRMVTPTETTTYTMTAVGADRTTAICQTIVTVMPVMPFCELGASPETIQPGDGTSLWWHTENTESANINNGIGNATPLTGADTFRWVTPTATTIYTMTATGANGVTATCQKTVVVNNGTREVLPKITLPSNKWEQVSLPVLAPAEANTVAAIFGDDITGVYGTDWVLYSYNATTNRYVDPGINGIIAQGTAYWIIQKTGANVIVDLPNGSTPTPLVTSPQCSSTKGCFELTLGTKLNSDQWLLLGHPFTGNTSWNSVRVTTSSGPCADGNGCTLNEAENLKIFHNQAWHYNSSSNNYNQLENNSLLNNWDGFWATTLTKAHGLNPKLLIPKR